MATTRRKLLPLLIAALTSTGAGAVSLGDIELHSYLGKPLDAVIPLNHLGDLDTQQLRISLGSQDDYQAMGVEFTYQHTQIKLEPVVRDGRGYVRVVTRDPIAEPYLNFVLNLRWPQGQVVREYAVLLDPPADTGKVVSAPVQAAPVAVADSSAMAQPTAGSPTAAAHLPAKHHTADAPADGSYRVEPGDSLWKLAARWRPAGVGVEQMMAAIHSVNPDAFVANDPARLKAMAALTVPNAEQIAAAGSLDKPPAVAERQVAADSQPAPSTPVPLPEPTGTIAGPRDEELVAENAALKSQVSELSDNVAALTANLDASQGRMHEMELKLGALVDQLERQRVTTQELATAAGVAAPRTESLVNDARAGDLLHAPAAHTPWWVHASYWVAIAALGAWVAFTQLWPRRRAAVLAPVHDEIENRLVAQRVPADNRWDTPVEQENYWHHRDSAADLPLDLVAPESSAAAESTAVPVTPVPERPSFADATVTRTAEDSVDPTISAGVFAAFGRYEEAEQVLNEGLQREPLRVDLQLQLLDVYKHQDKREAFLALSDSIAREHADDIGTLHELATLRSQYLG